MYQNLLIVDDEIEILSWLEEMFRYEFDREIGVYTANSAIEALDLLKNIKFDVVLTDIRMPGMDGITLFQKIKENWPRCKTVFLTGFGNFDEMYQLLQNRDVRYILKSEDDDVIQDTVRKALDEVIEDLKKAERKEERFRDEQENYYIRELEAKQMLEGKMTEEEILRWREKYEVSWDPKEPFLMFLIRIDSEENLEKYVSGRILENILRNNFPVKLRFYLHELEYGKFFLFCQSRKEAPEWEEINTIVQGGLEYSQELFRNSYGTTFSVIMKSAPDTLGTVNFSGNRLRQIMIGYLGNETEVIFQEESLEVEGKEEETSETLGKIPVLRSYLELRKRKEYFDLLSICTKNMGEKSRHDTYALEIYYSIAVMLLQFINEDHIYEQLAFRVALFKLTRGDIHENWMEAVQYLFEVSDAVFQQLGDNENALTDRALTRVVRYIDEHISDVLSLTTLAYVGGFNSSYLSRLFKQVYGTTVTDFILEKRMKLAEKLLSEGTDKIQDISVKVGYTSPNSFSRAFRSYTGVSPAEYREAWRKTE